MAHRVSYSLQNGYVIRDERGVFVARRENYKLAAADLLCLDDLTADEAMKIAMAALRKGI